MKSTATEHFSLSFNNNLWRSHYGPDTVLNAYMGFIRSSKPNGYGPNVTYKDFV